MALQLARLFRGILQLIPGIRAGRRAAMTESRQDLSRRYLRELSELVDDRQITTSAARQVIDDLFEPAEPSQPRRLRAAVWQAPIAASAASGLEGSVRADCPDHRCSSKKSSIRFLPAGDKDRRVLRPSFE